ncbi:MAG: ABC transporter ATP-binding protein [Vicinamibacteria bacterium]
MSSRIASTAPIIILSEVSKVYHLGNVQVHALHPSNLSVDAGELVAIVGPSGSGKSTLMNLIGCLDQASGGSYELEGRSVASLEADELADVRNRKIGFVFQNFNLLPYGTAAENVELPMIFAGESAGKRKKRSTELLEQVGLAHRSQHRPTEMSGGEMQRVAIARALANRPSILLADEPTGNLDTASGEEIIGLFNELHREGHTILLVTHNPEIAERMDRTIVLRDGQIMEDTGSTVLNL